MITNEQIEAWIADAKKATVGKWWAGDWDDTTQLVVQSEIHPSTVVNICEATNYDDRDHIANLCPANAIQILEELKHLRNLSYRNSWK